MYLEKYLIKELNYIKKKEQKILEKNKIKKNKIDNEIIEKFVFLFEKSIRSILNKDEIVNVTDFKDFKIIKRYRAYEIQDIFDLNMNKIKNIDSDVNLIIKKSKYISATHGIVAGVGGITLALSEIPIFLNHIIHSILKIGLAYGFCNRKIEIINALDILNLFFCKKSSDDFNNLEMDLDFIEEEHVEDESIYNSYIDKKIQTLAYSFANEIAIMKLYQGIPIAGGAFGAIGNYNFIKKVLDLAHLRYKKHFILNLLKS